MEISIISKRFSLCLGVALAAFISFRTEAAARLPAIFSDHMVLQRDATIPIWGWADPGESVGLNIAGQTRSVVADSNGKWRVDFDPISDSGPMTLSITANNEIEIKDVLIGEVWIGSGQSNMQLPVRLCRNLAEEKASANFPEIRFFKVEWHAAETPQSDCKGKWVVCTPETVGEFAGTAFFFGREIHQAMKAPVGMISSCWGGTSIEAWTSLEIQEERAELDPIFIRWKEKTSAPYDEVQASIRYQTNLAAWKESAKKAKAEGKPVPRAPDKPVAPRLEKNHPANLFNGMIAPLIPYAVRGAIWYQGENNAWFSDVGRYDTQLPLLVSDWRKRWQKDFPFAWVQLPNFRERTSDPGAPSAWALMRESMLRSLSKIPNSGMAVTIDIGEADDIHPTNKQEVGRRLSLWALAKVYEKDIRYSGPLLENFKIRGDKVILTFKHAEGGLMSREGNLKGFAVAGEDRKWVWAKADADGNHVIVSSPEVKHPTAVRYGWADNPDCNLVNETGLPASPFRTDQWPTIVQAK